MSDERRGPERSGAVVGAEPELLIHFCDPATQAKGYAIIDTLATGVAYGGVRVWPRMNWTDLAALARSATVRYQLARVALGGAKVGLCYDPRAPDADEVLGRFLRALEGLIGSQLSLGPDLNVDEARLNRVLEAEKLPWRMSAVQRVQGWPKERYDEYVRVLATPSPIGPPLREVQVALGVGEAVLALGDILLQRPPSVVVIGDGNFGTHIARLLAERGAQVVGLGTQTTSVYAPEGMSVAQLAERVNFRDLPASQKLVTDDELCSVEADVLVLAREADAITLDNVGRVKPPIIIEAATRSITRNAEKVLFSAGKRVFPSFAATGAGAVIADAILRNGVTDARVLTEQLTTHVRTLVHELVRLSAVLNIPLREAGIRLAFHRWQTVPPEQDAPADEESLGETIPEVL